MTKAGFWKKDWYHRLVPVTADTSVPPRGVSPELLQIGATLQEAESALNTDRKPAESFAKAGYVAATWIASAFLRTSSGKRGEQNVAHRDVKPANVMYEPENDVVKATDFGIARITDSSKTKTGTVLAGVDISL